MATEADTCRKFVVPKLQAAGWNCDPHFIAGQRCFTTDVLKMPPIYRRLLGTLHLFDNSSDTPCLMFKDKAGWTIINDAALCERLRKEFAPSLLLYVA